MNPNTPLSKSELISIVTYFKNEVIIEKIPEEVIFNYIGLREPYKENVYIYYKTGINPLRQAEVELYYYRSDKFYKFIIDLFDEKVNNVSKPILIEGARPQFNCPDDNAEIAVLSNEQFRNAMKKRGLTDYDIDNYITFDISLDGIMYDVTDYFIYNFVNKNTKFKLKTTVFNTSASKIIYETKPKPQVLYCTPYWNDGNKGTTSMYVNPISDVFIFYNRLTNKVIKVVDNGKLYPVSKGNIDWERPYPHDMKPLITTLPEGPSYKINGNVINWGDWEFNWSFDPVYGLSINNVSFLDRTTWRENQNLSPVRRSILYKANLSELLAIYNDSSQITVLRNFYDLGEYPARDFIVPLIKGIDVPDYADLLSVFVSSVTGEVYELSEIIGIYEKDDGMLWRHTDYPCVGDVNTRGRKGRKLVFTSTHSIGNYDYTFNWNFYQDGKISYELIASGCLSNSPSYIEKLVDNVEINSGTLVRPNIIASNHSHFACVRMDFSVDGIKNTVSEVDLINTNNSYENPYGNKLTEKHITLTSEKQAIRKQNFDVSRKWVIENENSKNYVGQNRAYKIIPFPTANNILNPDQRICVRAPFMLNNLYVTKYRYGELYVAGRYVVENEKADGLPKYIKNNENIVDKNIVVWYCFGFGHKPDIEQYPVMSREISEFSLSPENFFNENPALYIAP
jgi:primary-amine oxidase